MLRRLTEEEPRNGTLELEKIADDSSTSARGGWGGVHSSDVGEPFACLGINGVPHQARGSEQRILRPAGTHSHMSGWSPWHAVP